MSRRLALFAAPLLLVAAACAPADEEPDASAGSSSSPSGDECSVENLPLYQDGQLTIATDSPAYDPWFTDNDPTNGKGYESAVAYALAEEMGFTADQVEWVKVRFNNSYKPGPKDFDFDINQISILPSRQKTADFSDGYYTETQALIALDDSPAADVTSIDDLKDLRLGAQTGTSSLTAIREVIQPDEDPLVFQDTNAAKQALLNDQVDAIMADFYTANYITAVEIPAATIVGQFKSASGNPEEFGLLFEKGNPLVTCVNEALATLRDNGTLDDLEQKWLSGAVDAPILQ
jgi:polar amino acid transport system substrate-binding protein